MDYDYKLYHEACKVLESQLLEEKRIIALPKKQASPEGYEPAYSYFDSRKPKGQRVRVVYAKPGSLNLEELNALLHVHYKDFPFGLTHEGNKIVAYTTDVKRGIGSNGAHIKPLQRVLGVEGRIEVKESVSGQGLRFPPGLAQYPRAQEQAAPVIERYDRLIEEMSAGICPYTYVAGLKRQYEHHYIVPKEKVEAFQAELAEIKQDIHEAYDVMRKEMAKQSLAKIAAKRLPFLDATNVRPEEILRAANGWLEENGIEHAQFTLSDANEATESSSVILAAVRSDGHIKDPILHEHALMATARLQLECEPNTLTAAEANSLLKALPHFMMQAAPSVSPHNVPATLQSSTEGTTLRVIYEAGSSQGRDADSMQAVLLAALKHGKNVEFVAPAMLEASSKIFSQGGAFFGSDRIHDEGVRAIRERFDEAFKARLVEEGFTIQEAASQTKAVVPSDRQATFDAIVEEFKTHYEALPARVDLLDKMRAELADELPKGMILDDMWQKEIEITEETPPAFKTKLNLPAMLTSQTEYIHKMRELLSVEGMNSTFSVQVPTIETKALKGQYKFVNNTQRKEASAIPAKEAIHSAMNVAEGHSLNVAGYAHSNRAITITIPQEAQKVQWTMDELRAAVEKFQQACNPETAKQANAAAEIVPPVTVVMGAKSPEQQTELAAALQGAGLNVGGLASGQQRVDHRSDDKRRADDRYLEVQRAKPPYTLNSCFTKQDFELMDKVIGGLNPMRDNSKIDRLKVKREKMVAMNAERLPGIMKAAIGEQQSPEAVGEIFQRLQETGATLSNEQKQEFALALLECGEDYEELAAKVADYEAEGAEITGRGTQDVQDTGQERTSLRGGRGGRGENN